MTPTALYRRAIETGALAPDEAQAGAVAHLDRVHHEILADAPGGVLAAIRRLVTDDVREPVRGVYLWGAVGGGKTVLVDMLHESLPIEAKQRVHFHAFMQDVHARLRALGHGRDPLAKVAADIADRARILSFDEFHVSDIADAMLLGRLLEALFARGVTLVATSNLAPDELYRDGLQRARFLPAIELIERNTEVVQLDARTDYRLRRLERAEIYHCPLDANAHASLERTFDDLAPPEAQREVTLEIAGRGVRAERAAEGIAWFEFDRLCAGPRAASDYLELARRYHTILVANVPRLDDHARDSALRFVHLVDVLYEHNVNLVVSAAAPPVELYGGTRLAGPFGRAASRLEEMRSREYLGRPHLP